MVVSERVTLNIVSEDQIDSRGGIFSGLSPADALPAAVTRRQRTAQSSRAADSALSQLNKAQDVKSNAAFVRTSEFTQLKNQVNGNQRLLLSLNKGEALVQGASGLLDPRGILNMGTGALRALPGIGLAASIAAIVMERFIAQFGAGGTRDTRVKVLDETFSNIGVENETDIASGRRLFLSNPFNNQGVPRGPSNTENLRDGIRIYNLRREGTYQ
jgi:hypothetical protein